MAVGSHREPNGKSADARKKNPPHDTDVVLTMLPHKGGNSRKE
jgi:hypothetical protein